MEQANNIDDYRHKLVQNILQAESPEEIKWMLLSSIEDLKDHQINGHLISRFIEKSINQLNGLSLLDTDIKVSINSKFAKAQLELIKRYREAGNPKYV